MWPWMQPNTAEPSSATKIWPSPRNVEMGHETLTMTHSGMTCQQAGMKFLTTPITKIWKAVQNVEIGVVWGGYGSFKVIGNDTIRWSACDFLFDFNRNCVSILYRFRDSQSKVESRRFWPTPPAFCAPVGVDLGRIRAALWQRKPRISDFSCAVVCVILRLAVLVELQLVTDRKTDRYRHRQTQAHIAYTALAQRREAKTKKIDTKAWWSGKEKRHVSRSYIRILSREPNWVLGFRRHICSVSLWVINWQRCRMIKSITLLECFTRRFLPSGLSVGLYSAVFTCIGTLGTPSRTWPLARKYWPGVPYQWRRFLLNRGGSGAKPKLLSSQ